MKKLIKEMVAYVPAPLENINLAMNENHQIKWNELLKDEILAISTDFHYPNYGDNQHIELRTTFAAYVGSKPENILVSTGSSQVLYYIFSMLAEKKVMVFDPDFFLYHDFIKMSGLEVVSPSIYEGLDVESIIAQIEAENVDLLIFSNPNNPLGTVFPRADLLKIIDSVDCYVVADEAYIDFYGDSLVDQVATHPKLLVLRTMSKGWGLPGLRLGLTIASIDLVDYFNKALGAFSTSDFNSRIAAAAMKHSEYMEQVVKEICEIRSEWLIKFTNKYGYKVYPSFTNFINVEVPDCIEVWQFLKDNHVNVSKFAPTNLRVSIGTKEEMARFEEVLDAYYEQKK
jgi:Histidinol-phosphate/aromatic aminotransferase and cobyric acid decarboxylase